MTKKIITNHSNPKRNKLPDIPEPDLILYHWSPSRNRNRINHYGLVPGSKSLQNEWKPPYVCYSDDPYLAWVLSGRMWPEINKWDLWMFNFDAQSIVGGYEIILDTYINTDRTYIKEYRIYERVYKRDLILLATRCNSEL